MCKSTTSNTSSTSNFLKDEAGEGSTRSKVGSQFFNPKNQPEGGLGLDNLEAFEISGP